MLLILFRALIEQYFSQDVLLFLVRIVVFHVIVMRLVKNAISIVITVRVFISYSTSLTHASIWVYAQETSSAIRAVRWTSLPICVLGIALTRYQKNSLVEAADDGYLGLLRLLLLLLRRLLLLLWLLYCIWLS